MFVSLAKATAYAYPVTETEKTKGQNIYTSVLENDPGAQCDLARIYQFGECGLRKKNKEAVYWYRKSAEQRNPRGQYNLAKLYEQGECGLEKNIEIANQLYNQAREGFETNALKKDAEAQYFLALMFLHGSGVVKDQSKAVKYMSDAAKKGEEHAQLEFGYFLLHGEVGVQKNEIEAIKWIRKSAKQGNMKAQLKIAESFLSGKNGLKKDEIKATKWFQRAAEQGHIEAQFRYGMSFISNKNGLEKNEVKAVEWLEKAAFKGHINAQSQLARIFLYGEGQIQKNDEKAIIWLEKGGNSENADDQYNFAHLYFNRMGATEDLTTPLFWWLKAAEQGHNHAIKYVELIQDWFTKKGTAEERFAVAVMYYISDFKNKGAKAVEWFMKTAELGNVEAMSELGELHASGFFDIPKDELLSLSWSAKALEQGGSKKKFIRAPKEKMLSQWTRKLAMQKIKMK